MVDTDVWCQGGRGLCVILFFRVASCGRENVYTYALCTHTDLQHMDTTTSSLGPGSITLRVAVGDLRG